MLNKIREWWNNGYRDLYSYADTGIECVALHFIAMWYLFYIVISWIFLFTTAPIWIIPYCIYKSRKGGVNGNKV